jgi:hypothetical protein
MDHSPQRGCDTQNEPRVDSDVEISGTEEDEGEDVDAGEGAEVESCDDDQCDRLLAVFGEVDPGAGLVVSAASLSLTVRMGPNGCAGFSSANV